MYQTSKPYHSHWTHGIWVLKILVIFPDKLPISRMMKSQQTSYYIPSAEPYSSHKKLMSAEVKALIEREEI